MKVKIAFLLELTALSAASAQAIRAANERARFEVELAQNESQEAAQSQARAQTEKRLALHEHAIRAESPADLEELAKMRHAELLLRQQQAEGGR